MFGVLIITDLKIKQGGATRTTNKSGMPDAVFVAAGSSPRWHLSPLRVQSPSRPSFLIARSGDD
ncbi:unnamed protein product [Musa acuminata subsp. malaccensis]|uniref:(wild Malaysian banana) hypothetical protein n=1 Tax=Musa acuminata subsp. malaccensis TaxID=214687 RepID=A0A8D7AYN0_MUSAM|nr:unnamed protein product [Musa acuminata subsp. malaccensis]